jgi:hypothetical protein
MNPTRAPAPTLPLSRRRLLALAPLVLASGCATRLRGESDGGVLPIEFQNHSPTTRGGVLMVDAQQLQPGDIILSAANGINSVAIRMMTLSPVSHACLYVGDEQVAEAVGEGVRKRAVEALVEEEAMAVALRHPSMQSEHLQQMQAFVAETVGRKYNFLGVMLQAPFSVERRLCELPLVPSLVRNLCVQGIGAVQTGLGLVPNDRFFCSEFVLEAYRRAGLPLTTAAPRLLNPADLLHMREGDVSSVQSHQTLMYVGHLKYQPPAQPDGAPATAG